MTPSTPGVSARMLAVQAPIIPIVGELIRSTPGAVSLGQGMVNYGPPPEVGAAIADFGSAPEHHRYGPVEGIAPLQEALRAKLAAENGVEVGTERRVVVTAGANMGFLNAVLAILDPGDEVILPLPYYFNHEMAVTMVGGRVVPVPTDEEHQLDPDRIRRAITDRTRAVVTISPNNPSGAVYPESALREVNEICRRAGVYHISDETYEYFTYGAARHFSAGAIDGSAGHTISLYSLSKAYGFASWRIGYMVIPERLHTAVGKIQDTNLICPPLVSQHAALGALRAGAAYCRERVASLAETRELVLRELDAVRDLCTAAPAEGAFYQLLRVHSDLPAMVVVERLIRDHGVAVIPGSTFGLTDGCYLRVSYGALERATVAEGMGRLVQGLRAVVG